MSLKKALEHLNELLIDEFLVTIDGENDSVPVYQGFLERVYYGERWFAIRNVLELQQRWDIVRKNSFGNDEGNSNEITFQLALITKLYQRLSINYEEWKEKKASIVEELVDSMLDIFPVTDNTDGGFWKNSFYDDQVETTVSREALITCYSNNNWLIILNMIALLPNSTILLCLGLITNEPAPQS